MRGFFRWIMLISFFAACGAFVVGVIAQLAHLRLLWAGGKGILGFAAVCLLFTISSYLLQKYWDARREERHQAG